METAARAAPAGMDPQWVFERVDLTAVLRLTAPDPEHSYLSEFEDMEEWPPEGTSEYEAKLDEPDLFYGDEFGDAVYKTPTPMHLIGGYGWDVQYSADYAPVSAPMTVPTTDGTREDTELPVLLAQIDTDSAAKIGWGDFGIELWVIDRADLAARRFDKVKFHWNSH